MAAIGKSFSDRTVVLEHDESGEHYAPELIEKFLKIT